MFFGSPLGGGWVLKAAVYIMPLCKSGSEGRLCGRDACGLFIAGGMNAQATSDNAALSDVPNEAAAALLRVGRGIKSSFNSGCERRKRRPPRPFAGAAVRARRQQASCFEAQTMYSRLRSQVRRLPAVFLAGAAARERRRQEVQCAVFIFPEGWYFACTSFKSLMVTCV